MSTSSISIATGGGASAGLGHQKIAFTLLDPAQERDHRRGGMNLAPRPRQGLGEYGADRAVVVGDEDRAVHVICPFRERSWVRSPSAS